MKKHIRTIICTWLCVALNASSVMAAEGAPSDYIVPEAVLSSSADKNEIEALAPEIVRAANLFEEEAVPASESDIDFSSAYCVYVDADIFADLPITRQKLESFMQSAPKVWVIPVHAGDKTVKVQVSKGHELSQVDVTGLSPEEQQEVAANAGKWQVAASTCYDEYTDYGKQIKEIMASQENSGADTQCILFGGVPGIQTVLAVFLEGDTATGIVSLQRDLLVEGDSREKDGGNGTTLQQNVMYSVEEYAKGAEMLRHASDDLTGGAAVIEKEGTPHKGIFIGGGFLVIVLIAVVWYGKKRHREAE